MNTVCAHCHLTITPGEPDPCLGRLPGVRNACCGHGGDGYIQFDNGATIRFPRLEIDNLTREVVSFTPGQVFNTDEAGNLLDESGKIIVTAAEMEAQNAMLDRQRIIN